ncbi:MAG TPA: SGNH/GDSL hydrolase family protein [Virgibacillus sp.]|nr:SGNH/GDSL hydrolase family protein [Virgibacillus sp.]
MRVVFIGDSITEAGKFTDSERLGTGYVRLIHDYLITTYPTSHFEILNNGISGNRIDDLKARWQTDVLDVKPDIISISIGINDVWQQLKQPSMKQIFPDDFKRIYDDLLQQIRRTTNAKIILMEPTIIDENLTSPGNEKLQAYVQIIHGMAQKYDALIVPTHQAFLKYLEAGRNDALTTDGIHMNAAGNMLMATTWLKAAQQMN